MTLAHEQRIDTKEIWKDVVGYEGLYKVSSFGNVSIVKNIHNKNTATPMKIQVTSYGYCRVQLTKFGLVKKMAVHRMVAVAFIPNKNNMPVVNHKSGVKTDNRVQNLEWCTYSHNTLHALENGLQKLTNKPVYLFDKGGVLISKFDSQKECALKIGVRPSTISLAFKRNNRVLNYLVSTTQNPPEIKKPYSRGVSLIDNEGKEISKYPSALQAARSIGLKHPEVIRKVCNGTFAQYLGYKFAYSDSII